MKKELLVPVGNYECLVSAINNGADAVYLAGKRFGARAFAPNFDDEELINAINLCHLYGVKIYITINTLINDVDFLDAVNYIEFLHKNNVDAVIMQDVGLINYVHNIYPNLEIHASTQMHVHNEDTLKFLENLGIKRVVFARELSLDYINSIKTPLEKEVFIHGALCISYSGQCLFSSLVMNRSGNKGACAGMCRLPYELVCNDKIIDLEDKYLLSPKELCSIDNFKSLMESDVLSFKIEGRMKSPEYVGIVTKIYRSLIDKYNSNMELIVDEEDFKLLKSIYNRKFTKGYLFKDKDIMNIKSPNHQGIKVGEVIEITNKKIKIMLSDDIKQFDGIRFKKHDVGITLNFIYDEKDRLINKGKKNQIIYLDNFMKLKELDEVFLTSPYIKIDNVITKKIDVNIEVIAKVNKELQLIINDDINKVSVVGNIVSSAKNCPTTNEDIIKNIGKFSDTAYQIKNISIISDENIFISVKEIKNLRRELIQLLNEKRIGKTNIKKNEYQIKNNHKNKITGISILARTKEQIKASKELNVDRIYTTDKSLVDENVFYCLERDLLTYKDYPNSLITDYGAISKYPGRHSDYYLNVTNKYTLDYLTNFSKLITLSPELTINQIKDMNIDNENVEVIVYGKIELMLMKYCPLNYLLNKDKECSICQLNNKYYLKDRNNELYRILTNKETHSTTILHYKNIDWINNISVLKEYGVKNFRIILLDENYEETKNIIERVLENE